MNKTGLFTFDFFPIIGGQGRHTYELYRRTPQNKLIVFSARKNTLTNHVQLKFPLSKKLQNIALSVWLFRKLEKYISKHELAQIAINCGPGGLFLFRKPEIPVIAVCCHTYWQQSNYIKIQSWKKIFVPFEKRTYHLADKIISISEDSKSVLVEKYAIPSDKITVIPCGINKEEFFPIKDIEKIPNSILYIGRIDTRKGVMFLIKSLKLATKKNPHIKLFLGGKGKDLSKLKQYVSDNNLDKNIEFIGFVPDEKLNEWYNKVQCVVVPSIFEGFGITVIEAMATGTPVIGTNVDGIKNIIQDQYNGFLVPYGNEQALSGKINRVLTENNDRIIKNAKKDIDSKYDWDKISKKYNKII